MSNKTIFKRIALVAVTALGAGVLSVAPVNAAAPDNNAVGSSNVASTADVLNISTNPSTTGDAETSATVADNRSRGLLANSTTQSTSSLTSTATVASSSEVVFYTTSGSAGTGDPIVTFVVEGATITEAATAATTKIYNQDLTQYSVGTEDQGGEVTAIGVTPKSGVTSYTVSMYTTTSTENAMTSTTATDVSPATIISGAQSKGTLVQRYLVTVAATSASGVYDASESYIAGSTSSTAADGGETNVDATDSLRIASQTAPYAYIDINLNDAYGVALGGKGALIISGTNGALIAYKPGGTAATSASDFNLTQVDNTDAAGKITVTKPAARANKSFNTTISISWNGVVVGTKNVTFLGEIAKVTATPRRVGALNASNTDAFRVAYEDDAGNSLIGLGTTATTVVAATTNSIVTGASIGTQGTSTDAAKGTLACAAGTSVYLGGGSADLQLRHVNTASGTVVLSNVFKATCQGNAYSYTASWDKASYTPGSVATLTITFKDRDGDIANGYDTVAASNLITITGGPSATAVTIPAATDKPDSGTGQVGIKTYQFAVGTTEGDFVAVVSVPDVNTRNSSQANQSVPYSVKSGTATVTNAEVLKSIVSLIASINKQIQALQKLILRR